MICMHFSVVIMQELLPHYLRQITTIKSFKEIQLYVPERVSSEWTELFCTSLTEELQKRSVKCDILQTVHSSTRESASTSNMHLLLACPFTMRAEPCIEHALEDFQCKSIFFSFWSLTVLIIESMKVMR